MSNNVIFWLQVAILVGIILNILKDFYWSKRQKEYLESISATKVLSELKALKELLDNAIDERDELKSRLDQAEKEKVKLLDLIKQLEAEIDGFEEELKKQPVSTTTTPQGFGFDVLKELSQNIHAATGSIDFSSIAYALNSVTNRMQLISTAMEGYLPPELSKKDSDNEEKEDDKKDSEDEEKPKNSESD